MESDTGSNAGEENRHADMMDTKSKCIQEEGKMMTISGGHVSDLVVARNCCMARMLPGEAELVSE